MTTTHHPRSSSSLGNATQQQACAACKYQRRKCAPDCILAPYFPHDRQRQFRNAHKLFGVSNITKIIRNLDPPEKEHAMRTIIFQSDVRAHDPVGGCYRIIRDLHRQIDLARAELELVLHQLSLCRAHAQQVHAHAHVDDTTPSLSCDVNVINADTLASYNPVQQYQQQEQQQYVNVVHHNNNGNHLQDLNAWVLQDSVVNNKPQAFANDCDDVKAAAPHLEISGPDRNYVKFEVEDIMDRSDKALFKGESDSIRHLQDHDLKGAATMFSLTNCNS